MAIRVATEGLTDLRLAADVAKPNLSLGRTIAGQSGQVRGWWMGAFVRIPASGFTENAAYPIFGRDVNGAGSFNANSDHVFRIGADTVGTNNGNGASRLRPAVTLRASTGAVGIAGLNHMGAMAQMTRSPDVFFIGYGVRNVGDAVTPSWQGFVMHCRVGGTPSIELLTVEAGYVTGTGSAILRQVFQAISATALRWTETGTVLEHVALMQGDFPWDTVNNRPHFDAIAALAAGSGASTLYDYDGLAAAQLAGTLPFANCDDGLSEVTHWFTLESLAAGLTNSGTATGANLAVNTTNAPGGGLVDEATIAPAHWAGAVPIITPPPVRFFGGRGTRTISIAGTWTANVQRRWERMSDGQALAGLDWATVTTTAGAFTVADVLPVGGPYRLRVRDAVDPGIEAFPLEDVLVGTLLVPHGQSGQELIYTTAGSANPQNVLGITPAAGVEGAVIRMQNRIAGTPGSYAKPALAVTRITGSVAAPGVSSGTVAMLNEWNARNPGHPLGIVLLAVSGSRMVDWANNLTAYEGSTSNIGHASFTFLGDVKEPGAANGDGSGIMGYFAWGVGRWVDGHIMMWNPNMSTDSAVRAAYRAAVDARFDANLAPWLVLPPWRNHDQGNSNLGLRAAHMDFLTECGARGFRGPTWMDTVSDSNGSLHPAFNSATGVPNATFNVRDGSTQQVGQTRLGRGMGAAAARLFDASVNAQWRIVGAWTDNACTTVNIELGRAARTLAAAAVSAAPVSFSLNGGSTWTHGTGFTVALDASATRLVLTPASPATWEAARAAGNLRVDYARVQPFDEATNANEVDTEPLLNGLLYDAATYRGRTDLATPAGNVLAGTDGAGLTVDGTRGPARLLTTERFGGTRPVTVRMMAADGVTVLRERTVNVAASLPFSEPPALVAGSAPAIVGVAKTNWPLDLVLPLYSSEVTGQEIEVVTALGSTVLARQSVTGLSAGTIGASLIGESLRLRTWTTGPGGVDYRESPLFGPITDGGPTWVQGFAFNTDQAALLPDIYPQWVRAPSDQPYDPLLGYGQILSPISSTTSNIRTSATDPLLRGRVGQNANWGWRQDLPNGNYEVFVGAGTDSAAVQPNFAIWDGVPGAGGELLFERGGVALGAANNILHANGDITSMADWLAEGDFRAGRSVPVTVTRGALCIARWAAGGTPQIQAFGIRNAP